MLKSLLEKIMKEDPQSEQLLFEMFYKRVYRTAYIITDDHYLAQDVVQETFEKAFKKLDNIKYLEKTGAWLEAIASKTAIDVIRKNRRWIDVPTKDVYIEKAIIKNESSSLVEKKIEDSFFNESIRKHILKLKPEYRQVIILKYIYELKDEEIAIQLEIKVGTG